MIGRIRSLRVIGILEGISYLVLLGVAMPLKYFFGFAEVVKFVGWIHGLLFILFIPAVFVAKRPMNWNFFWVLFAMVASLLPFGTFMLDRFLAAREKELLSGVSAQ